MHIVVWMQVGPMWPHNLMWLCVYGGRWGCEIGCVRVCACVTMLRQREALLRPVFCPICMCVSVWVLHKHARGHGARPMHAHA
jgi:hypothetical protein